MPDAPSTNYLGQEKLYAVDDRVVYHATPYWQQGGMWAHLEGRIGYVVKILPTTQLYNTAPRESRDHPWKYSIAFEGESRNLTPATENIRHAPIKPEWEV